MELGHGRRSIAKGSSSFFLQRLAVDRRQTDATDSFTDTDAPVPMSAQLVPKNPWPSLLLQHVVIGYFFWISAMTYMAILSLVVLEVVFFVLIAMLLNRDIRESTLPKFMPLLSVVMLGCFSLFVEGIKAASIPDALHDSKTVQVDWEAYRQLHFPDLWGLSLGLALLLFSMALPAFEAFSKSGVNVRTGQGSPDPWIDWSRRNMLSAVVNLISLFLLMVPTSLILAEALKRLELMHLMDQMVIYGYLSIHLLVSRATVSADGGQVAHLG